MKLAACTSRRAAQKGCPSPSALTMVAALGSTVRWRTIRVLSHTSAIWSFAIWYCVRVLLLLLLMSIRLSAYDCLALSRAVAIGLHWEGQGAIQLLWARIRWPWLRRPQVLPASQLATDELALAEPGTFPQKTKSQTHRHTHAHYHVQTHELTLTLQEISLFPTVPSLSFNRLFRVRI